jgi:hypothetical protein
VADAGDPSADIKGKIDSADQTLRLVGLAQADMTFSIKIKGPRSRRSFRTKP